jgi:hypothetical protein
MMNNDIALFNDIRSRIAPSVFCSGLGAVVAADPVLSIDDHWGRLRRNGI